MRRKLATMLRLTFEPSYASPVTRMRNVPVAGSIIDSWLSLTHLSWPGAGSSSIV